MIEAWRERQEVSRLQRPKAQNQISEQMCKNFKGKYRHKKIMLIMGRKYKRVNR